MGASLSTARRSKQPEPDINVTPLVDVVLVLLIIFMVMVPALAEGEHIELPTILKPDAKPKDMNPIDVTLAPSGSVVVEEERIAPEKLKATLQVMHEKEPDRALLLKTDEAVPYRRVRETFAILQGIGFKGVSLKVIEKKKPGAGAS
ncbi:MAG TPA: biopolymer transporter ExbD [Polyangiaceae bacterium]|nr:biopolymer transporter ExbD [Polyangiaceae bacterium]